MEPAPEPPTTASAIAGGSSLAAHYLQRLTGGVFLIAAALAFYGWRSIAVMFLVVGSTALGVRIWRGIGRAGPALRWPPAMWMALLLSLMLPAQLAGSPPIAGLPPMAWAILPAAGLLLASLLWLLGSRGLLRFHPLLLTYLIVALCYHEALTPHLVLRRAKMVVGDVANVAPTPLSTGSSEEPWFADRVKVTHDAIFISRPASQSLSQYTRGRPERRGAADLEAMLRDDMPPLEDLVIGGHPGPVGTSSAMAVLVGGLVLIYRRLANYGVPLIVVLAAYAAFLVLPVPVLINDSGVEWRSLILRTAHLDWKAVLTFANYELLASPLLFMAFFLAAGDSLCPETRWARWLYALLLGFLAAAAQLYISAAHGPYLALAIVAMVVPWLGRRRA